MLGPPEAMGTAMAGAGTGAGLPAGRSNRLATRSIAVPLSEVESSLEQVPVTLGLSTDTLVQVVTGLAEGDRVVVTTAQSSRSTDSGSGGNRPGGFGFAMPMGGPPGGP
jgi:multidrug efflux pump subunit AcrA (membrane-fusion protein)